MVAGRDVGASSGWPAGDDSRSRRRRHRRRTDGEQGEQRGDREAGVFRVDVPAEWVLSTVTWLVVAAADGVRLGRLAARDVERLLGATVLDGLRRPPAEGVS